MIWNFGFKCITSNKRNYCHLMPLVALLSGHGKMYGLDNDPYRIPIIGFNQFVIVIVFQSFQCKMNAFYESQIHIESHTWFHTTYSHSHRLQLQMYHILSFISSFMFACKLYIRNVCAVQGERCKCLLFAIAIVAGAHCRCISWWCNAEKYEALELTLCPSNKYVQNISQVDCFRSKETLARGGRLFPEN